MHFLDSFLDGGVHLRHFRLRLQQESLNVLMYQFAVLLQIGMVGFCFMGYFIQQRVCPFHVSRLECLRSAAQLVVQVLTLHRRYALGSIEEGLLQSGEFLFQIVQAVLLFLQFIAQVLVVWILLCTFAGSLYFIREFLEFLFHLNVLLIASSERQVGKFCDVQPVQRHLVALQL